MQSEQTRHLRPEALPSGTEVGHWRVVGRLGVGGYGAAYQVEDIHHPGVMLALKLALHSRDARAEREVVLLMDKAVHPNVVRIHAREEAGGPGPQRPRCARSGARRGVGSGWPGRWGSASSWRRCTGGPWVTKWREHPRPLKLGRPRLPYWRSQPPRPSPPARRPPRTRPP